MNTTPEQRAQWAKLDAEELDAESDCLRCCYIVGVRDGAEKSRICDGCAQELAETAVPALCKDVSELEAQLAEIGDYLEAHGVERFGDTLPRQVRRVVGERDDSEDRLDNERDKVERLTALLRDANVTHETSVFGSCRKTCLRCRIDNIVKELTHD